MTPLELVTRGQCTAACLAASSDPARCRCPRCGGRLHGVLARADVTTLLESRRAGRDKLSDAQVVNDAAG